MNAFKNVLVAVDFSTGSHAALMQAARIAHLRGARLHVLHVVDSMAVAMLARSLAESYESRAKVASAGAGEALQRWVEQSRVDTDGESLMIAVGAPFYEILEHARKLNADLLVAGITGSGNSSAGAGVVSSKLARKSKVPVLLVRSGQSGGFRKIVAGIDFSTASQEVAELVHGLAVQDGAHVDFLHVWQEPWVAMPYFAVPFTESGVPVDMITPEQRDAYVSELRRELHAFVKSTAQGIDSSEVLLEAESYGKGIAEHALQEKADLIIVGGKGRTNLRYALLGSTAERLLSKLPCSVLVVKAGEPTKASGNHA